MPTVTSLLASAPADHLALVVPGGTRLTYGQLRDLVELAARELSACGIGPRDRVAMALPNGTIYACVKLLEQRGVRATP